MAGFNLTTAKSASGATPRNPAEASGVPPATPATYVPCPSGSVTGTRAVSYTHLEDAFLEYARYVKHSYGTPKAYVEEQLDAGKDVLLEIEIQGALQVKEKRPDTLLVFITPPTAEELERRLRGRGTETEEVIKGRMERAKEEAQGMDQYDYCLLYTSF